MTWCRYFDKTGSVKTHTVNKDLFVLLCADLKKRYKAEICSEMRTEENVIYFEPGGYGSYFMNQPKVVFTLEDHSLRVDVLKVDELLFELEESKPKFFPSGREYYKLYSRVHCLVLSPSEKKTLLEKLTKDITYLREQGNHWLEAMERDFHKNKTIPINFNCLLG